MALYALGICISVFRQISPWISSERSGDIMNAKLKSM